MVRNRVRCFRDSLIKRLQEQEEVDILDDEGNTISRVKVEKILPQGGMAIVFKAKPTDENAPSSDLAVKCLAPSADAGGESGEYEERFKLEASQLLRLKSEYVVRAVCKGKIRLPKSTQESIEDTVKDPAVDTPPHVNEVSRSDSMECITFERPYGAVVDDTNIGRLLNKLSPEEDRADGLEDKDLETPVIVMEYIDPKNLFELQTEEGNMDTDRIDIHYFVKVIAKQLVAGGKYFHKKGILHRDMKPENVMITKDDKVKILDLGIHKAEGNPTLTQAGFIGTVAFSAPEQSDEFTFTGENALPKETLEEKKPADYYQWGATLYSFLLRTNKDEGTVTPYYGIFDSISFIDVVKLTINPNIEPAWPCERRLEVHPSIEAAVMTLIDKGEVKSREGRRSTKMRETFDGAAFRLERIIAQDQYYHPQMSRVYTKNVNVKDEGGNEREVNQTFIVWKSPGEWISEWEQAKTGIPLLKNTGNYDNLNQYVKAWLDILDKAPRRLRDEGETPRDMTRWDKLNENIKLKLEGEDDKIKPVWPQSQRLAEKEKAIVQEKIKYIDQAIKGIASYVISHISPGDDDKPSEADIQLKDKGEWFVNYLRREQHFLARYAKIAFPGKKIYRGMNVTFDEIMEELSKGSPASVDSIEDIVLPEAAPVDNGAEQLVIASDEPFEELNDSLPALPMPPVSDPAQDISDALKEVKDAIANYDDIDITDLRGARRAYRILQYAEDEAEEIMEVKPKLAARYSDMLKQADEEIKYWESLGRIEENLKYLMGLHSKASDTRQMADIRTAGNMFETLKPRVNAIRDRNPQTAAEFDKAYESYKSLRELIDSPDTEEPPAPEILPVPEIWE